MHFSGFVAFAALVLLAAETTFAAEPDPKLPAMTVEQVVNMVERRKLTGCVLRVTCELSCNVKAHGKEGEQVFKTLERFEEVKTPALVKFHEAAQLGREAKSKCEVCGEKFNKCQTSTPQLLRLAQHLNIKD